MTINSHLITVKKLLEYFSRAVSKDLVIKRSEKAFRSRSLSLSSPKMSEFWQRKIRTHFHRLDHDKDGVISQNDFELMTQRFCSAEKTGLIKQEQLRKCMFDLWLKYTSSIKTNENAVVTEAVLIESLKTQKNDPKLKASMEGVIRGFLDAIDTNEDGYIQRAELRRAFDSFGTPDASFAEQGFNAIDSNHNGKLSIDEATHAFLEFLLSEDEDSPYNLSWGPLVL